ncbi:MAG: adenosylcobinamide-GDP ribazoletransferase [Victivallaceae bacterium]
MRGFLAALSVMTLIPVGKYVNINLADLRMAKFFFPLVGLVLGVVCAAWAWVMLRYSLPNFLGAVIIVLLPELITKFFHLDGLADSADGFLSSRSKERILEIMRDSRVGVMGVIGIAAVILLKVAAFYDLNEKNLIYAALLVPVAGRCAGALYIELSQYARPDGLGAIFFEYKSKFWGICAALLLLGCGGIFSGSGLLSGLAVFILVLWWKNYTRQKIGGATGDTIGAIIELSETLFLIMAALGPQWEISGFNRLFN